MTVCVRTDLGGEFARKVAELAAGREVYISVVFNNHEFQKGKVCDWIFTTGGDRDDCVRVDMTKAEIRASI